MKTQRAPFLPVTSDVDDDRLERLAQEKGVGSLVKPIVNQNRAGEGVPTTPAVMGVQVDACAPPSAPTASLSPEAGATPRSRMKTVNLELPDYVWTDLKIRAAHKQTSVRHIIMTALQGDGVTIHDVDMVEDGRRNRGKDHMVG